jgi:hypothetical protein
MGIQEVIDYVMETPYNTNRAVLESMLDSIGGSEDSEMINVIMEVTPGMSFDFKCNYSYQELSSFDDESIIKLDEIWTNGGTDNEYHGFAYFKRADNYINIFTMPAFPGLSDLMVYTYRIDDTQISRVANSISA